MTTMSDDKDSKYTIDVPSNLRPILQLLSNILNATTPRASKITIDLYRKYKAGLINNLKITQSNNVSFLHVFCASAECHLKYFLEKKSYDEQIIQINKYGIFSNINHIIHQYFHTAGLGDKEYNKLKIVTSEKYYNLHFDLGIGIKATTDYNLSDGLFLFNHMMGDILLDSWNKLPNAEKINPTAAAVKNALDSARAYVIEFKIPIIDEITLLGVDKGFIDRGYIKFVKEEDIHPYIIHDAADNDYKLINILHKCSEVHLIQQSCTKYKWEDNKFVKCDSTDQHIPLPIKTHEKYTKFGIDPISTSGGSRSNKSNLYKLNKYISKNKQIESLLYNYK